MQRSEENLRIVRQNLEGRLQELHLSQIKDDIASRFLLKANSDYIITFPSRIHEGMTIPFGYEGELRLSLCGVIVRVELDTYSDSDDVNYLYYVHNPSSDSDSETCVRVYDVDSLIRALQ